MLDDLTNNCIAVGQVLLPSLFWNRGALEQASQVGLLHSLLYEPGLIRRVFSEEWVDTRDAVFAKKQRVRSKQQFSRGRLRKAFRLLAEQDIGRVCLFVDGLDEFNGDAMEMVQLFQLVSSANIKTCLSSKPWVVFEDAFQEQPKLRLQDLIFGEIEVYVKDNLFSNQKMKSLHASNPQESAQLVRDIMMKASGVYLWVMLVVRDLLNGITSYNKIPAVQQRIRALPFELRDLYIIMVKQVEPRYLQKGSGYSR
ncbi:hypothetical protein N431DRAFT_514319 [Stipitochalara longipes BDJ]|nr:hypothetical protein N431DRAFT_514319 [Stipitochalara longipes BDJ]